VLADSGVEDKRLLVYEAEFPSILKVMGREGDTLSDIMAFHAPRLGASKRPLYFRRRRAVQSSPSRSRSSIPGDEIRRVRPGLLNRNWISRSVSAAP
jgi:hypothetical protein